MGDCGKVTKEDTLMESESLAVVYKLGMLLVRVR